MNLGRITRGLATATVLGLTLTLSFLDPVILNYDIDGVKFFKMN
jgi:acyl dehydratase